MDLFNIFSLIMLGILAISFINLKYGIALFVIYLILVPAMNLNIVGFQIGENYINTSFLLALFFHKYRKGGGCEFGPIKYVIAYFLLCLAIMPLSDLIYGYESLDRWRRDAMMNIFFPLTLYNVIKEDRSNIKLFRCALIIAIIGAIGYGYFMVSLGGFNPYQESLMILEGIDPYEMNKYYAAEGEGRLFGHMSSVFRHPMTFGLFIGLSVIYLLYIRNNINRYLFFIIFSATSIMAILCGVRSVLGGLLCAFAFYLYKHGNKQLIIKIVVCCIVLCSIISLIPEVGDYLGSMVQSGNKSKVAGSSISSRWIQFLGAFDEFMKNPLFGLGYSWTDIYLKYKELHPICYAFESLIYVIMCNLGLAGFLIWKYLIKSIMKYNNYVISENVFNSLIIFYISYSCITGEYGYMKLYLVFYIIMIGELQYKTNKTKSYGSSYFASY